MFELHVVRETELGTTYEDTGAHLSESEREITEIVFAALFSEDAAALDDDYQRIIEI